MSFVTFSSKLNNATIGLTFDFISQLTSGETISGAVVTATLFSGTDSTPSTIISGSATVSGSIVTQTVTAGVIGVIYLLSCAATTSTGAVKIIQGYLAVTDSNPFEA